MCFIPCACRRRLAHCMREHCQLDSGIERFAPARDGHAHCARCDARRLLRQLITEYAVLAGIALACALWLAQWLVAIVPSLMPNIGFPVGLDLRIDHRVLAFAACITLLSILICGVVPGMSATRSSPLDAMRSQGSLARKLKMPARKLFVIAQSLSPWCC